MAKKLFKVRQRVDGSSLTLKPIRDLVHSAQQDCEFERICMCGSSWSSTSILGTSKWLCVLKESGDSC